MDFITFNLFEDGDGGGMASATLGNTGGMGNVVSPTVSTNGMLNTYSGNGSPTNAAAVGSGDIAAHSFQPATKLNIRKRKKKKYQLTPKNESFSLFFYF